MCNPNVASGLLGGGMFPVVHQVAKGNPGLEQVAQFVPGYSAFYESKNPNPVAQVFSPLAAPIRQTMFGPDQRQKQQANVPGTDMSASSQPRTIR